MTIHARRGERALRYVPQAIIEYPFEVLVAMWGLISGPAILTGLSRPSSLTAVLPTEVRTAWGIALTLGAATIAWGLARRRYGTATSRGLTLISVACVAYSVVVVVGVGALNALPSAALLLTVAAMCGVRGWWLRTRDALLRRIAREAAK